jgi:hypothetical protein
MLKREEYGRAKDSEEERIRKTEGFSRAKNTEE